MGLLKGEKIVHKKIRMPSHIPKAIKILEKIASLEDPIIEFIDITENDLEAKKSFAPSIKRCENIEIKLNELEKFANEFNIPIDHYKEYKEFKAALNKDQQKRQVKDNSYFDFVENEILEEYKTICDLYESYNKIKENLIIEIQRKITLEKYFSLTAATIIDQNNPHGKRKSSINNNIILNSKESNKNIINNILNQSMSNASVDSIVRENQYESITGLCFAKDELRMKRMIFRVSHDKVLCTYFDAEFPEEFKPKEPMKIFVMFCPKIDYLIAKMIKVCDVYNCPRFDVPDNYLGNADSYAGHVMEILPDISEKILEHKNYLFEAKKSLKSYLEDYILINFIDGEIWVLQKNFEKLQNAISSSFDDDSTATFIDLKDYGMDRPTYIEVNEFTYPFQEIVNQYGIPNYHEINPGYFTIITFPFLFGIMFGDIGHGLILLVITLYLFYLANKNRRNINGAINSDELPLNNLNNNNNINILDSNDDSMLKSFVQYRYFFLLCSIFAIFCGFMYNEFFAIPLNLFGTCYTSEKNGELILEKIKGEKCVYPIGLDPSWIGTNNELTFSNSLKMKLSIIVGVLHMMLGIFIRGINNLNKKNMIAFYFEFIPQFLFMGLMFGYLITMIYYKWGTDYDNNTDDAPSLLSIMINMAIKLGEIDGEPLFESFLGFSQESINQMILVFCILLVPVMLFVKPIQFYLRKSRTKGISYRKEEMSLIQNENKNEDNLNINEDKEDNFNNEDNANLNNSGDYSLSLSQESAIKPNELYSQLYKAQKLKYKEESKTKFQFIELFIGQLIEVIEYVLGTVSNTASYLRLWALSLAHTALSHVFIEKTFIGYIQNDQVNIVSSVIGVFIYFLVFLLATAFILIFMDAMECVLHTLRLHWVEFQNKFYKGDGYLFEPFSFKIIFNNEEILKE